jgi:small subunit ribosomal protein S18
MAFRKNMKGKGKKKPRTISRPRVCRFCADRKITIDFKEGRLLSPFITERGKIVARRISGNCAKHQREITLAIKRARMMALIPYTATQLQMVG